MKVRAFTLVELLVVMAIIAILAAVLIGVVRGGRESSDSVQCANNLRVLAAANLRYASEHDGRFCPAQEKTNRLRWHGERSSADAEFDPTKGMLSPYLGREARVKMCPTFRDMIKGAGSFENGCGGYGYNAIYVGGTPRNKWEGELAAGIPNPAATLMFADTAFSRKDGLQEYPFAEPWQWVAPNGKLSGAMEPSIHFRHRGLANIAWCDGRVSAEKPSKIGGENSYGGDAARDLIGWIGPEEDNGWWNPRYGSQP